MTKCPKCGKPATQPVIDRDGQCSRCTDNDRFLAELRDKAALAFAQAEIHGSAASGGKMVDPDIWADTIWRQAEAFVRRRPK